MPGDDEKVKRFEAKEICIVESLTKGGEVYDTVLVPESDVEDALSKAIQSGALFPSDSYNVKKVEILFGEGFFSLHRNELYFPTHDDPLGQHSVVDKYKKTNDFCVLLYWTSEMARLWFNF